jgi:xanthine/uracil/vitamin C permease (AzgA family)
MISDSIAAIVTMDVGSGTGFTVSHFPLLSANNRIIPGTALISVGLLMMSTVGDIDFQVVHKALPGFMTIVMMLFTYSITQEIGHGRVIYLFLVFFEWLIELVIYCLKVQREFSHVDRRKRHAQLKLH